MKPSYVNNGTYGCIFRPGISCKILDEAVQNNINKVSKVFKNSTSRNEEIQMHGQIVEQIDPEGLFTVKLLESCDIQRKRIAQEEVDKCKNFNVHEKVKNTLPQILYEYGGHDLTRASTKYSFEKLFIALHRAFRGLVHMEKKKFAHIDIKPDNIVYNSETEKLSLIDFGLGSPFGRIYRSQNEYLFEHTYPYFPPEFPAFIQDPDILRNTKNAIRLIVNRGMRYFTDTELEPLWSDVFGTNLETNMDALFQDVKKIQKYANRLDVYMLGVTTLEMLYLCCKNKTSEITRVNKEFYRNVLNLIRRMVEFLPSKRFTPKEAYKEYKNVVSQIHDVPESPKKRIRVVNRPALAASVVKPKAKECPPGKMRNPLTGRCITIKEPKVKECPPGKMRNPLTGRCITIKEPKVKECPPGKMRNPLTGRCIKANK